MEGRPMGEDGTDEQDLYTAAQYREHVERQGHRVPDAFSHAGVTSDPELSRFLSVVEAEYDPVAECAGAEQLPGQARDLEAVERIRRMEATDEGRRGLYDGSTATLKYQTGDVGQQADVSGLKAIQDIDDLIDGPAPVVVVIGEMGAGKSNFASLLGQRFTHKNPAALVGTNIRSLREKSEWTDERGRERDGFLPSFPALKEWLQQDGNPLEHDQTPKLAILDELSSKASGSGKDGQLTRKLMGPLVFKVRKYGGALIVIAHDESSIHPMLWRVGVIVKKVSQKRAVVADRITSGQIRDVQTEIEGIPPTDWRYNDKEASGWSWTETSSEGDEPAVAEDDIKRVSMWTIAQGMEAGKSPRAIAENVPYSHQTVRNWWEEYQNGGEKREWVSDVQAAIA
jgi:hypothetical protein